MIRRHKHRLFAALLATLMLLPAFSARAEEEAETETHRLLENLPISVDGGTSQIIRTLHYEYGNNRYVSLRDMGAALNGSAKSFSLGIEDGKITITAGEEYVPTGGEGQGFPETTEGEPFVCTTDVINENPISFNGREVRYMSFLGTDPSGIPDCYMSVTDLAIMLDLDLKVSGDGMLLNTAGSFSIDLETLEDEGFFCEVHSALVGDADTGDIYVSWEPDLSVPIASTTKLMTYLCLMDAISSGEMSMEDRVTIPEEAAALSKSEDGVIPMETGTVSNVSDLLKGMLLPSSNECAVALAVHLDGSEEAFTERMNRKAQELGLSEGTFFYNCHGLPMFTDDLAATKIQNHMTAMDMFLLASHILHVYPQIREITSLETAWLESLKIGLVNSNPLLYNYPGVFGLKTGTTNMSGLCLVSALETEDAQGVKHTLLAMEFGAEDGTVRATICEELLRYGVQRLLEDTEPETAAEPEVSDIPDSAEELIRMVLDRL